MMGLSFVTGAARLRAQALETCFVHLSAFSVTDVGYPRAVRNSDILLHYRRVFFVRAESSQVEEQSVECLLLC